LNLNSELSLKSSASLLPRTTAFHETGVGSIRGESPDRLLNNVTFASSEIASELTEACSIPPQAETVKTMINTSAFFRGSLPI
jgi:hypothetical protein